LLHYEKNYATGYSIVTLLILHAYLIDTLWIPYAYLIVTSVLRHGYVRDTLSEAVKKIMLTKLYY